MASDIGLASPFAYLVIFLSASLAGFGIFAIYRGGQAFWSLGAFAIRVERHKFGVLSSGIVLVQCYLAIGRPAKVIDGVGSIRKTRVAANAMRRFQLASDCFDQPCDSTLIAALDRCQSGFRSRLREFLQAISGGQSKRFPQMTGGTLSVALDIESQQGDRELFVEQQIVRIEAEGLLE